MTEPLYCVNHPNVETYLRCSRCGSPICARCAVQMEVGYICPACRNRQQQVFYADFRSTNYLIAVVVALPLTAIAGWIIPATGWFAIFLGPLAGAGVAEAVRWAIRRRRGRYTWLVVAGCIVIGSFPWVIFSLLALFSSLDSPLTAPVGAVPLLWYGVYLFTSVGTAIARLK